MENCLTHPTIQFRKDKLIKTKWNNMNQMKHEIKCIIKLIVLNIQSCRAIELKCLFGYKYNIHQWIATNGSFEEMKKDKQSNIIWQQ